MLAEVTLCVDFQRCSGELALWGCSRWLLKHPEVPGSMTTVGCQLMGCSRCCMGQIRARGTLGGQQAGTAVVIGQRGPGHAVEVLQVG